MLRTARATYRLQANDEAGVYRWIEKINSLYFGYLQSRRGTSSQSPGAGGRARSSTIK